MAASRAEHSVFGVVEVHIAELMTVISSTRGGTIVGKRHTQPVSTVHAGEVDGVGGVTNSGELGTRTIEGNTLSSSDLNLHTRLNGQVGTHREVLVGRVDANWAVSKVPVRVRGDIRGDIGSLTFVGHDAVVC